MYLCFLVVSDKETCLGIFIIVRLKIEVIFIYVLYFNCV